MALDTSPQGDPSQSPTLTAAATQMGVIMGTAAYMSPEQARGKPTDRRADIWSFGVVLFEMLTGQRAFAGEDVSVTLADVIRADLSWDTLPSDLPPGLAMYLRRCLEKEPSQRIQAIGDVRLAMAGAFEPLVATSNDARASGPRRVWQRPAPLVVGAGVLVVTSLFIGRLLPSDTAAMPSDPVRLSIVLPQDLRYLNGSSPSHGLAISPDGSQIVFRGTMDGQRRLFRRSLDDRSVEPISGTESDSAIDGAKQPLFSPDGTSVAFFADGTWKKVGLDGSLPITLVDDAGLFSFGTWTNNDEFIYAVGEGLFRVSADGGASTPLIGEEETPAERFRYVAHVPGTDDIVSTGASSGEPRIEVQNADTGARMPVVDNARLVAVTTSGHLLFERDGVVMAATFDATQRRLGPAVPVLDGYAHDNGGLTPQVAVSASGTLAYVATARTGRDTTLEWVESDGGLTRIGELPAATASVDLSPDGSLAVLGIVDEPRTVFLWDMVHQVPTGLEVEGSVPRWHPDGRHVALSRGPDLVLLNVDDGSEAMLVEGGGARSPSFSAEGDKVVFSVQEDILALLPGETTPQAVIATDAREHSPALSPDGQWLAYVSNESGEEQVYVAQFPSGAGRRRVTTNPGNQPLWRQDGRALFFRESVGDSLLEATNLRVVAIGPGETLDLGPPESLFTVFDPAASRRSITFVNLGAAYQASPDGTRFLMVYTSRREPLSEIVVVQNWFEELKRLVPTN